MLGPALQQLFLELQQFDARDRSNFENRLYSELLELDQVFEAVRQTPQHLGGADVLRHLQSLTAAPAGAPSAPMSSKPASGFVATHLTTECSKADCPNKRIT